jgi:hypothetical protein
MIEGARPIRTVPGVELPKFYKNTNLRLVNSLRFFIPTPSFSIGTLNNFYLRLQYIHGCLLECQP